MKNYQELETILSKDKIRYQEPMKKHTTAKVGGPCDCMVVPTCMEDIIQAVAYATKKEIPYHIIGNGSNLLVRDGGIDGMIIKIGNKFSQITQLENNTVEVLSGCSMPRLAIYAKSKELTGLEFSCGIPGTIGGGIRMNAGAYGSEMANVVEEVTYLDEKNQIHTLPKEKLQYSYRHSIFCEHPTWIILSAKIALKKGIKEEIEKQMKENNEARHQKQPLEFPNAGSTFRRPEGYFVGKLVQDAGLRGFRIGDAQVSEKHTGFVVNLGNATFKDFEAVISHIQEEVYKKFGVRLQTEIEIIGRK